MPSIFSFSKIIAGAFLSLISPCSTSAIHNKLPALQVVQHVRILQELKNKFALENPSPITSTPQGDTILRTQSEAYWHIYSTELNGLWKQELKKYRNIINECFGREREMFPTHYVLYHGQNSNLCIFQDVLKQLYETMHIHAPLQKFELMRAWNEAQETINIDKYLSAHNGYTHPADSKDYLCANLALFGNHHCSTSCTFYYFMNNYNVTYFDIQNFLERLFKNLNLNTDYIKKIIKLASKIATKEGRLFQIFIPKAKIDQCVFLSSQGFVPYPAPIIAEEFDVSVNRHRRISPILDLLTRDPWSIKGLDYLQARVMCSKDLMLNPQSDIQIEMYTTVDAHEFALYEKELKSIINQMIAEWLQTRKPLWHALPEFPIDRLFNLIVKHKN